jgi:hypothetical protein
MPEGAIAPKAKAQVQLSGLAAVDLSAPAPRRARYDEYTLDDEVDPASVPMPVSTVGSKAVSRTASRNASGSGSAATSPVKDTPSPADLPAESVKAVKVTKKKKKKRAV